MAEKSHVVVQAAEWRALAKRARRLGESLLDGPDRDRLVAYSRELDAKAADLEAQANSEADRSVIDGEEKP